MVLWLGHCPRPSSKFVFIYSFIPYSPIHTVISVRRLVFLSCLLTGLSHLWTGRSVGAGNLAEFFEVPFLYLPTKEPKLSLSIKKPGDPVSSLILENWPNRQPASPGHQPDVKWAESDDASSVASFHYITCSLRSRFIREASLGLSGVWANIFCW